MSVYVLEKCIILGGAAAVAYTVASYTAAQFNQLSTLLSQVLPH
jgi:hypothetical protein